MSITVKKTRIRQIISRQVVSVSPETPLTEAISIMADAKISCLVVVDKKMPQGIFTERDLVRLADRLTDLDTLLISDVMTSPVVTIPGTLSIFEAYSLMLTNR
ncbi:MAG: CBS domain-containing protein, partial [Deltaproteobacteria bacterium]|nr:CBS domain-containing protein [Deltaproteobacteria bacterium]